MVNKRQYVIYLSLLLSLISITVVIGGGGKNSESNKWKGLSAVAFGTSLTSRSRPDDTGGYLRYLPELSGMKIENSGVGSGALFTEKSGLNILNQVKSHDYDDIDVVLIEGFVNDWYYNENLGTYLDTDVTTVCGVLRTAINYILEINPAITVIVIFDPIGTQETSELSLKCGRSQYDYYEELAKVAGSMGIPVVKLYSIGNMNSRTPQYFIDNIHPTELGAKQTANMIWKELQKYEPKIN